MTQPQLVSRQDLLALLPEFLERYRERPIADNAGGMQFNHAFAAFAVARHLAPPLIVESGVWKGQSTWLFEQACPNAQLVCIDPNPGVRRYTSRRAEYRTDDFALLDWSDAPCADALCFFDDHQNAYQRLIEMRWWGFRRAIFEDNFPCGEGDSYSLRHVRAGFGHPHLQMSSSYQGAWRERFARARLERTLFAHYARQAMVRHPNVADRAAFERNVRVYQEIPPVVRYATNNWGGAWDGAYASEAPLLDGFGTPPLGDALRAIEADTPQHAFDYGYLCVVELR
ncbi:MAG: hypothetical protein H3C62_04250 [Gemmatimonadaceae bacterium]|nr:hypothetical protein [Gemmatimonadaceae bacterium]